MKKRLVVIAFCLAFSLCWTACSNHNNIEATTEGKREELPKDSVTREFTNQNPWNIDVSGVNVEKDYSQIEVFASPSVNEPNAPYVTATIINHHKGYGFYYYLVPQLEKWNGEQWSHIELRENYEGEFEENLVFCGFPETKNDTEYQSAAAIGIARMPNYRFDPGEYRMIVQVGPNIYYAFFTVEE